MVQCHYFSEELGLMLELEEAMYLEGEKMTLDHEG